MVLLAVIRKHRGAVVLPAVVRKRPGVLLAVVRKHRGAVVDSREAADNSLDPASSVFRKGRDGSPVGRRMAVHRRQARPQPKRAQSPSQCGYAFLMSPAQSPDRFQGWRVKLNRMFIRGDYWTERRRAPPSREPTAKSHSCQPFAASIIRRRGLLATVAR